MSDNLNLVQLSQRDGKAIMALTALIGWDLGRPDWEAILACGPVFGHKHEDGSLHSTAAIFPSGPSCAVIGAVMVHPDHRRQGLGAQVVQKCLGLLAKESSAHLVSTPVGDKLYEQLGFKTIGETLHLEIDGAALSCAEELPAIRVRDLVNVVKLDATAFGGQRYGLLKRRISQSDKSAVIEDDAGQTIAFALAVPRPDALQIGPIIAPDCQSALRLVNFLAAGHPGTIRLIVPASQSDFLEQLKQLGFKEGRRSLVKSLDAKPLPGLRANYMALDSHCFC